MLKFYWSFIGVLLEFYWSFIGVLLEFYRTSENVFAKRKLN